MADAAERNACIGVLRSLCTSRRDTSLHDLIRDYGETEGGVIPFKRFGFARLEDFLQASGQFKLSAWGTVGVRASEASSHIQKLVCEQKQDSKKKRGGGFSGPPPPAARPRSVGSSPRPGGSPAHQPYKPYQQQMQPSLVSQAYQQMKVRSPFKTGAPQQQHQQQQPSMPSYHQPSAYHQQQQQRFQHTNNGHYNHKPAQQQQNAKQYGGGGKQKSQSPLPPMADRPTYTVTFNNGETQMLPANAAAQRQVSVESNGSSSSSGKSGDAKQQRNPQQQQQTAQKPQQPQQSQQQQQQSQQPRAITKNNGAIDLRHKLNEQQAATAPAVAQTNGTNTTAVDLRQRIIQKQQQQQKEEALQQHQQQLQQQQQQQQQHQQFDLRQRLNAQAAAAAAAEELVQQQVQQQQQYDMLQRLNAQQAAAAEELAAQRQRLDQLRDVKSTMEQPPQQRNVTDMLRSRLNLPQQQHQQMQQQQQVQQQMQKPPVAEAPAEQSTTIPSAVNSLSSRLHNRLKISVTQQPEMQQQQQQQQQQTYSSPPVQHHSVSSTIHSQQQQQQQPNFDQHSSAAAAAAVRTTLNNRLARKASADSSSSMPPLTQMQMPAPPPQQQQQYHQTSQRNADTSLNFRAPTFTPQKAPPNATDNITTLAVYCTNKSFAVPSYNIFKMPKTARLQCRLMINGITYSSYPLDFETVREAKLYTAGEALARLRELDVEEQYPLCMDLDRELVVKVYECLRQSPYGMFERNIPEQFQKTYRESLPVHWSTLIVMSEHAHLFAVADSVQGNKIIHALTASDLQQQQHQNYQQAPPSQPQSPNPNAYHQQTQTQTMHQPLAIASPTLTSSSSPPLPIPSTLSPLSTTNYAHMEPLCLPWSEKYWNVYITNPRSTVDVWARLIGADYSDRMDNLIVDIELDLMHERRQPSQLLVGHIYLVVVSECTYRVRIDRNDFARRRCLCFYVDVGDEEWIGMDELFVCKAQFLRFPAQAICLSLFGLEDCAENPIAGQPLAEQLLNKTLIADVTATRRADYEQQERSEGEAAKVVVALYDTSSDEDVQLNSVILERICAHSQAPQLECGGVTNVVISHVTDGGEVYCQPLTMTGGIHYVQKLIHGITRFGFDPERHRWDGSGMDQVDGGRLVLLVQDEQDGRWYRATVLQRAVERSQVFYVDHGMTRTVATAKMYRLDSMCQVLHSYPFQAIVCRLHDVPKLSAGQLASLRGYLRPGVQAMVKVRGVQGKVPVVRIFIRQQADGPLFTVNDVILLEQECESSNEDGSVSPGPSTGGVWNAADVMPKHAVSSRPPSANGAQQQQQQYQQQQLPALTSHLQPPLQPLQPLARCPTPAVGERFEVHVTMASNPHNFKVRPYRQVPQFQSLMVELQEYCRRTPAYVPDDQVCIEQAYACQQPDNVWYRVVVQNVISPSMFLICYCDYGDIVVINSDRLKVLPALFRQLPALAISARLSGVRPLNRDWETDDCLRFQQLTVDKKFVSRIDAISRNGPAHGDEAILELTLVDVSTATDINVNQLLVRENRAIQLN